MKLNIKIIASVILAAIMILGVLAFSSPPSPIGSDEWPLPPAEYSAKNITSSLNISNFTFFGGQPIARLGQGLDFPWGSEAYYYLGSYKNETFLAFVVAKLPDQQSAIEFGARALTTLKETVPENETQYLVTNEGGYLLYKGGNQTLALWYGSSWYFEILVNAGGKKGIEAITAFKRAILNSYKNQKV